jgi:late competence protein required for DNA uptake (superfamily II DNA/RNA helicase)
MSLKATKLPARDHSRHYICRRCGVTNQIRKGRAHSGYCQDCKPYAHEYERNTNA